MHSWAATVAYAAIGGPPFGRGPSMAIMDRVRRGEHDLGAMSGPLRDVVAACLHPEPLDRPTLDAVLGWLRPQTTRPAPLTVPPPVNPDADPFHDPLAVAGPVAAESATRPETAAPHTLVMPGRSRRRPLAPTLGYHDPPPQPPHPFPQRLDHPWEQQWEPAYPPAGRRSPSGCGAVPWCSAARCWSAPPAPSRPGSRPP